MSIEPSPKPLQVHLVFAGIFQESPSVLAIDLSAHRHQTFNRLGMAGGRDMDNRAKPIISWRPQLVGVDLRKGHWGGADVDALRLPIRIPLVLFLEKLAWCGLVETPPRRNLV